MFLYHIHFTFLFPFIKQGDKYHTARLLLRLNRVIRCGFFSCIFLWVIPISGGHSQSAATIEPYQLLHAVFYSIHNSPLWSSSRSPTCHLQLHHPSETFSFLLLRVVGTSFRIPRHTLPPTRSSVPTLVLHVVGLFPATSHGTVDVNWHCWRMSGGWFLIVHDYSREGSP